MKLEIEIPDEVAEKLMDNIGVATNYDGSTKSKEAWVKDRIIAHIKALNTQGAMKVARDAQAAITKDIK